MNLPLTRRARNLGFAATVAVMATACAGTSEDEAGANSPVETATTAATATDAPADAPAPTATNSPSTNTDETTTTATTTPASTPATAPATTTSESRSSCRRLSDFDDSSEWFVVNDGVMGGRSNAAITPGDSSIAFTGTVVTAGGGFTSIRYRLDGTEMDGTTKLEMRIRPDARTYSVTLEDDAQVNGRSVSHGADLTTSGVLDADGWTIATVDYTELEPSIFGRSVDAAPFNADAAREVGIIIADGVDGDFALDIDWIDVCEA